MHPTVFDPAQPTFFPLAMLGQDGGAKPELETGTPATGETAFSPAGNQAVQPGPTTAPVRPAPGWMQALANPLVPLILLVLVFYFFVIGGNRKRDRERRERIEKLGRGDRVVTIGGIIGSVVDTSGDEIVLKIDENNNTKIRITRAAVASVTKAGEAVEKK